MSWSLYVTNTRYADAEEAVKRTAALPDSDAKEQAEQVQVAKDVAVAILKSGAVANDESQDVNITISGHANSDHKSSPGSGNDSLSIAISQTAPRAQGNA